MLDLPGICSTLLCGHEGVGTIASDGVHNASLRIFNLIWGRPEEQVRWRRWQGLMMLLSHVRERFSLLMLPATGSRGRWRPRGGGGLGTPWRWPSTEMASARKWSNA